MNEHKVINKTRQRLVVSAIALIFFLPVAASWLIYYFTDIGKGDAASYGELISPPVMLADRELAESAAGGIVHKLYGKWNLVYIPAGDCTQPCRARLGEMLELRTILGKDAARIQLLVGIAETAGMAESDTFAGGYGDTRLLLFDYAADRAHQGLFEQENLYLIDPLGNMMMKYSATSSTEGIIRDLKRLLRYSRIG